ncbi:unnamed protein product [Rhizophagus irregularis]|nr:unnamed protein product [Rhizophagus irregularis]
MKFQENQNQVNNKENNEIEIHHALIEEKEAITKKLVIYGFKLLGTLRNVSLNYGEGKRITDINDKYSNIEDGHVVYLFLVSLL